MYSKSTSALSLNYKESESSLNSQLLPDLSHLSEAERQIISSVIERQRADECNQFSRISSPPNYTITNTTINTNNINLSNTFNRNVFIRNLEESEFDQLATTTTTNNNNKDKTTANSSQITSTTTKPTETAFNTQSQTLNKNPQQIKYSTLPHTTSHFQQQQQQQQKKEIQNSNSTQLQQCHSISDIANEAKQRYGSIDTGNICDICKKTKFAYSGAGHICFNCKLRCCVRCAFKYQTKTKLIWTCIECKKKQDTLLKSGKWFSDSNNLNRKNFTSDYILNKGINTSTIINNKINLNTINTTTSSILNTQTNTDTSEQPQQHKDVDNIISKMISSTNSTIETNSAIKTTPQHRRVLPTIVKQKSVQSKVKDNNDDDEDYDDLSRRQIITKNAQLVNNNNNNINTNSARSSIDNTNSNSNPSRRSIRQPLIKQVSLNNPPTYLSNRLNQDNEFSLYGNNNNNNQSNNRSFTSTQDLGNQLQLNNLNEQQSNSSQNSSINNINRIANNKNRERLQDPLQILKVLKSSQPNSRLNSMTNISSYQDDKNPQLYLQQQQQQQQIDQITSKLTDQLVANKPTTRRLLPTSNPVQRAKQLLLLNPADSLSSDPSDYQQSNQIEFKSNLDEMSRKQSKTKRTTRSRKQPTIPVNNSNNNNTNTSASTGVGTLLTQQQLIQKALLKQNLKQHSLTSSDDDLIHMNTQASLSNRNTNEDYQDPEEEEDNFNDDDVDEEIRSTTELSTNDEMDLESSVSINNTNKNRVNLNAINSNQLNIKNISQPVRNLNSLTQTTSNLVTNNDQLQTTKTIDDYLVQNLKKEEILAAKMSKFLSPTNWQLSSDGKKMIGHLILKHDPNLVNSSSTSTVDSSVEFNTSSSLGIKIVGGRANPLLSNQLCAYIVKVKKDSIADTVGLLQVDDEVVKWNDKLLRGLTYDEVYSIITKSRPDNQVELIVERLIDDSDRMKLRSSLWNNESTNNADLKTSQHRPDQDLTYTKIDSNINNINKSIGGKIQLKIFHDSIERILYINVLNLSINYTNNNNNEQKTLETTITTNTTTNDFFNTNYNNNTNNYNSNTSNRNINNEVVESIYCLLHLLLKKRNIEKFKKISKVCNLDKTTGLYLINEAFTFEPVNSIDLHDLSIDFEAINYLTKQPLGKLNIEYSEAMFDNQLLNLNMLPINSNNQTNLNKTLSYQHQQSSSSQHSTADNNNNHNNNTNQNSRRRQLPQIPPPVDNRSEKSSVDLTEKTHRSKLDIKQDKISVSDSEAMTVLNKNKNTNNDQFSLYTNQQQPQTQQSTQPIKLRTNNLLPKQYSDRSDYSSELNDESLFTNIKQNTTFQQQDQQQQHQQPVVTKRQQPVVPIVTRPRLRETSQTSRSPININDDQQLYGQQQQFDTAQFNSPNYRSVNTNPNTNVFFDNINLNGGDNNNINDSSTKHLPIQTNSSNYRPPSPPSPPSTITAKPIGGQRQLPQPIKTQARQQQPNNPYLLPQEWPDADFNNQSNTNNNIKKPDRLIEKSLLLDLKTKTSDLYASNSTNNKNNNNFNTGLLSQSPDNNNSNNKLLNINNKIQSPPFKQQNSFDYPNEYSSKTTNILDNQQQQQQQHQQVQSNNTQGTTVPRRAEKLFSTRHLNQRLLGNNLNNNTTTTQPCAVHGYNRNGFEFDSDGSEFSNVSKLSSNSVRSAQSELLKGANNNTTTTNNNNNRKISKLQNNNFTDNNQILQQQTSLSPLQQQSFNLQEEPIRLPSISNQDNQDLLSNNFNQINKDIINTDWNVKPSVNEPILQQQSQQQDLTYQEQLSPPASSSTVKQSKQIEKSTANNNTNTTTTPPAATSTTIKSTTNIPIPSYIKSKDNPTFDFFAQFSTPVKQTSKNNSTMSLPGQSMQQTTINNTTITKETDGTLSDSALSNPNNPPESGPGGANKKRRPSMAKALVILGLSKKSNSASNLTLGKRYGFARSEEIGVVPELRNPKLNTSSAQGEQSGNENNHPKPRLWSGALKLPHEVPYSDFIEALGPGQKISRQALGLPCLGEVKMSLFLERQKLNIEIQQARNLKIKIGYRVMPISVYIKLYLFNGTSCVEKQKTTTKRRTLNPTFQETLKFETNYRGTILQITCWGDYGKLDRKVFMGVAQIVLDELNLSNTITGWYKLYPVNSIVTDFSTLTPATDLCETESGYSLSSK